MAKYHIQVVYDTDTQEGIGETVGVNAPTIETAIKRINSYTDSVANHLPKIYEIHLQATKDLNPNLSPTDLIYLENCPYSF